MKYPYVIIDSDTHVSDSIQIALEGHTDYLCVGVAKSEQEALDLILDRKPRLIFLEPEVDGTNGGKTKYSLLSELRQYMTNLPEVVVITNTEAYAIEGIRNNILDYILKPMKRRDIIKTILRFEKDHGQLVGSTLCFKSYGDYRFVNMNEVLYLKADNNTTDLVMSNGKTIEAFKTLKHFQNSLPHHFVRIHNSYIINTNYVSRIHFGKAKCAIKNTNDMIPFSKTYKDSVEGIKDTLSKKSLVHVS